MQPSHHDQSDATGAYSRASEVKAVVAWQILARVAGHCGRYGVPAAMG